MVIYGGKGFKTLRSFSVFKNARGKKVLWNTENKIWVTSLMDVVPQRHFMSDRLPGSKTTKRQELQMVLCFLFSPTFSRKLEIKKRKVTWKDITSLNNWCFMGAFESCVAERKSCGCQVKYKTDTFLCESWTCENTVGQFKTIVVVCYFLTMAQADPQLKLPGGDDCKDLIALYLQGKRITL